ncbi:protein TolR [Ideonella dechloratans]|uniref:Protein TolR n=1 Tax=Ideonella dechloratans TaxID=36863 RepID=A0A643FDP2_IDEDE|nr:biopolymer transporter ExbD [Ideonella dechloratans]KAB0583314.1 protein TolR [Ideonella dechloratans]UFU11236.1 biopolymer transporter ExbD [Ideonella dechloratans]
MPGVAPRGGGRRRRSMNEINMVPFIDVMLVLLIIFMVSAPMITTGVVDLPSVGKAKARPQSVVEIIVQSDDKLQFKIDKGEAQTTTLNALADQVLGAQAGSDNVPVIISADKQVRYESVVKVMDTLQRRGVQHVGLSVRQGG